MGKIEISPVGWACIIGLGCKYPDLWMYLMPILFVFFAITVCIVGPVFVESFGTDPLNSSKYELSNNIKTEVIDSSRSDRYWEEYYRIRNKEIEVAASIKRGKGIWEERKKEIEKEKEDKKQEKIDKQVEQWRLEAREKLNS